MGMIRFGPRPGVVLALGYEAWGLAIGLAAAAVRPWGWYVLLVSQPLVLVWGVVYATVFSARPADVAMVLGFAFTVSAINGVYFYKRRAMFGAAWRWNGLERLLPWSPAGVPRHHGHHDPDPALRDVRP